MKVVSALFLALSLATAILAAEIGYKQEDSNGYQSITIPQQRPNYQMQTVYKPNVRADGYHAAQGYQPHPTTYQHQTYQPQPSYEVAQPTYNQQPTYQHQQTYEPQQGYQTNGYQPHEQTGYQTNGYKPVVMPKCRGHIKDCKFIISSKS